MRSYFVQGFMTLRKRSSSTRGAFTAYYLTLRKHMAQQGVNRRCFYALCVDKHSRMFIAAGCIISDEVSSLRENA